MRLLNIASGSTGNSTYIGTSTAHVLIDAGISRKRIFAGLNEAEVTYDDIDGILVTHEHIDHIATLGVLERTREVPIYATRGTIDEIKKCKSLGKMPEDVFIEIEAGKEFTIKDITFLPISTSHDSKDPVCYKFKNKGKTGAVVTDLGVYDDRLVQNLKNLDMLLLEANHDVRMLEVGPYPYMLKRRILGELGHLSNEASGQLLSQIIHDNLVNIMLGHLSRENNTSDLALLAVRNEIDAAENEFKSKDFDIKTAFYDRTSKLIEV